MGVSASKTETCEALRLCKERKKFMKKAIDSRYNLAASHLVYLQSLQNIGITIRKFAETEIPLQLSPPKLTCNVTGSPDPKMKLNYMKSNGSSAITVNVNPPKSSSNNNKVYVDDNESLSFTMSPPQPPPPPPRLSWDYFDPKEGSFRFMCRDGIQDNLNDIIGEREKFTDKDSDSGEECVTPPESGKKYQIGEANDNLADTHLAQIENAQIEECDSKNGCFNEEEREFITHGAKDFLSSIKDIENCFIRASKSGIEVSRMLEANKIEVGYSEAKGNSTASSLSFLTCFGGETETLPHTEKIITWKRSTSSRASPLHPPSNDDNENRFMDELCMIAGRHSSTLERLYAWERKLYDEVKASESIRKEYDQKCDQLRNQFAKDLKPQLMDKTRAVAKDLHSRMRVALHTVDSISKRIQKMRDEELQPQLIELIQGLTRMWKSMYECHHAQYITISLTYHSTISKTETHHNESKTQIMSDLVHEIESFGSSFANLVNSYTSYVESINGWLHNCIILPKERVKNRRAFSPRRAVAPPIYVICRDWSTGFHNLPSQKLGDAVKDLLFHVRCIYVDELEKKQISCVENGEDMKNGEVDLSMIHSVLTKVFDRLTKFSEASLKMYEDIKENSETAGNVYSTYQRPPRAFSI